MKVSVIIPVYFNEENLWPLYRDIKNKFINVIDYDYEIVMVNDGSQDRSYDVMKEIASEDKKVMTIKLSKNFGSHAAILCGLENCSGDCAIVKSADLQEPTEMMIPMVESWKNGNNVVLAVRDGRDDSQKDTFFANVYYWLVRKVALPNMPKSGFDIYLIDRKVINVLTNLDETNSALTGQILWSGFKTDKVYYHRLGREIGRSRWTLKKKIRLVMDTVFSFSSLPISIVMVVGGLSFIGALVWAVIEIILKLSGVIVVQGWTTLFIFNLLSFGVVMITLGVLGEYLWRTFDASRNRPPYLIEEKSDELIREQK